MLEVFSLPPFLDKLEYSLLLQTVRMYPNGLPSDEMLINPSASITMPLSPPSPLRHGRTLRTPFSSGVSYIVQKGLEAEKTWWSGVSWRGMRQLWRWLSGSPPLADPARRLAEHHQVCPPTGPTSHVMGDVPALRRFMPWQRSRMNVCSLVSHMLLLC